MFFKFQKKTRNVTRYAGIVKRHVFKLHIVIYIGVKQTERVTFLHVILMVL